MSDDDAGGSQSLFVVLRDVGKNPYLCSILQLDPPEEENPPVPEEEKPPGVRVVDGKWVAHFKVQPESPPIDTWVFSHPPSASSAGGGDLYILPDWSYNDYHDKGVAQVPVYGAKFNCTTKSLQQPINAPNCFKFGGIAVTVGLDVYFMTHPDFLGLPPFDVVDARVFERYNAADDSWEVLDPFPAALARLGPRSRFVASAVWDDHTILLNVNHRQIWAYNVSNRKWYHVHVQDDKFAKKSRDYCKYQENRCCAIKGQAFVVQNTIYALSDRFDSVLALSIEKNQVAGGDLEYRCSIRSECFVPPVLAVLAHFEGISGSGCDRSLALLGEDKLCVVRSCHYDPDHVDYQPIQVTYIKLKREEGKMDVTNHCIYRFEVPEDVQFHIQLCFSLPMCKTATASSEGCSTLILNPLVKHASDEDVHMFDIEDQESTCGDYELDTVAASNYLKKHLQKKRKRSEEINKEPLQPSPITLNMFRMLDQKLDGIIQLFNTRYPTI